jgi:hypothetical protein
MMLPEVVAKLEANLAELETFWQAANERKRSRWVVMHDCERPVAFGYDEAGHFADPRLVSLPQATLFSYHMAMRMAKQLREGKDASSAKAMPLGSAVCVVRQQLTEMLEEFRKHIARFAQGQALERQGDLLDPLAPTPAR